MLKRLALGFTVVIFVIPLIRFVDVYAATDAAEKPSDSKTEAEASSSDEFELQVNRWISQLSEDERFTVWKGASWKQYPLGPGMHGWVVLLHGKNGEEIGYLIVSASEDGSGYVLVEYGVGENPLFSLHTLMNALSADGLEGTAFSRKASAERIYGDALHSYWKVSEHGITRYADAVTGAWLPIGKINVIGLNSKNIHKESLSGKPLHKIMEPGDPYMSLEWLSTPESPIHDWASFVAWLMSRSEGKAVYAPDSFGESILNPVGVAGYHWWGTPLMQGYVALSQNGLRYVPLEHLLAAGSFY